MKTNLYQKNIESILEKNNKNYLYKYVLLFIFNKYEKIYLPLEKYQELMEKNENFYISLPCYDIINILRIVFERFGFSLEESEKNKHTTEIYFRNKYVTKFYSQSDIILRHEQCVVIMASKFNNFIKDDINNGMNLWFKELNYTNKLKRISLFKKSDYYFDNEWLCSNYDTSEKYPIISNPYMNHDMVLHKPMIFLFSGTLSEANYFKTIYPDKKFLSFFYDYINCKKDRKFKITNFI